VGERRGLWRVLLVALAAAQLTGAAEAKVSTVATAGSAPGTVYKPDGIAVDADGAVIVGEAGNARGQKFSPTGASLLTFGGQGSGPGQLGDGTGDFMKIAVGAQGDYFVVGGGSGMVNRFNPDGSFEARWPHGGDGVSGIAALANGDIYVATYVGGIGTEIVRYTADGAHVARWPLTGSSGRAVDIAGAGDRLYVLAHDGLGPFVVGYDGAGSEIARWHGQPSTQSDPGTLRGPTGIGMAANGNLLVAGASGIEMFSPSGEAIPWGGRAWGGPFGPDGPGAPTDTCGFYRSHPPYLGAYGALDVAGDAHGNLWFTARDNLVHRIDLEPIVVLDYAPHYSPSGLAVGTIVRLDASGSVVPWSSPARFEWDFDGDGAFERDTGTTPTASHVYRSAGTRRATVRVTGPTGLTATKSQAFQFVAWHPSVDAPRALTYRDVRIRSFSGTFCSPIERYEWDLDGDGTFERDTGASGEVMGNFTEAGKQTIAVRTTRAGGHTDVGKGTVIVYLSPPPGPVGVSINDGDLYTNSRDVDLHLVWRRWTADALVAQDGGFKHAKKIALWEKVPWRLEGVGSSRLPRVVYVRFGATFRPVPAVTYQDDIILDQTRPVVTGFETLGPTAATAAGRRHRLAIRARDSVSGVERMQLTTKRSKPGRWRKFRRRAALRTGAPRAFVRVRDRAGNRSRWRRVAL
jgi:hypothetical protein